MLMYSVIEAEQAMLPNWQCLRSCERFSRKSVALGGLHCTSCGCVSNSVLIGHQLLAWQLSSLLEVLEIDSGAFLDMLRLTLAPFFRL